MDLKVGSHQKQGILWLQEMEITKINMGYVTSIFNPFRDIQLGKLTPNIQYKKQVNPWS